MATNHSRRLDRLEEIHNPNAAGRIAWHRVIGDTDAELEERMQEMIASGEAKADDGFICRLIVSPS